MAQTIPLEQNIAAAVNTFAATHQLGTFIAVYKPRIIRSLIFLLLSFFVVCGMAQIIPFMIYQLFVPPDYVVSSFDNITNFIAGMLVAAPLLGLGLWLLVREIRNLNTKVYGFSSGLVQVRMGRRTGFRWDQVENVWQNYRRWIFPQFFRWGFYVRRNVKVHLATDKTFVFNGSLYNFDQLGATIVQETTSCLLPKANTLYTAGFPLHFGKLTLSQKEIRWDQRALPWGQVLDIVIVNGRVLIRIPGKRHPKNWAKIRIAHIPNIDVFTSLPAVQAHIWHIRTLNVPGEEKMVRELLR